MPKPVKICGCKPLTLSATPPLIPIAMSKYKEMNFDIWAGISKLDRTAAANNPKRKNKTAGSSNTE
jgi:hypothetical protein